MTDEQLNLGLVTPVIMGEQKLAEELEKALAGNAHALQEALTGLIKATREYREEVNKHMDNYNALLSYAEDLTTAQQNFLEFIRNLQTILNADRESALKIKGIPEVLQSIALLLTSSPVIKLGVGK